MNDSLLLPLAYAASGCYKPGVVYAWENDLKLAHLTHTVVNDINTFAFAGTEDWQEWLVDFFAIQVPVANHPQLGWVHEGFLINAQGAVNDYILPALQGLGWPPCYVTGHSKGAGEAVLACGLLRVAGHAPVASRVFEPPRVGGPDPGSLSGWRRHAMDPDR